MTSTVDQQVRNVANEVAYTEVINQVVRKIKMAAMSQAWPAQLDQIFGLLQTAADEPQQAGLVS